MWTHQRVASFFGGSGGPKFDKKLAETAVKSRMDYFQGRCIKTNISGDSVEPWLYDRDAGSGKFKEIVDGMRAKDRKEQKSSTKVAA